MGFWSYGPLQCQHGPTPTAQGWPRMPPTLFLGETTLLSLSQRLVGCGTTAPIPLAIPLHLLRVGKSETWVIPTEDAPDQNAYVINIHGDHRTLLTRCFRCRAIFNFLTRLCTRELPVLTAPIVFRFTWPATAKCGLANAGAPYPLRTSSSTQAPGKLRLVRGYRNFFTSPRTTWHWLSTACCSHAAESKLEHGNALNLAPAKESPHHFPVGALLLERINREGDYRAWPP